MGGYHIDFLIHTPIPLNMRYDVCQYVVPYGFNFSTYQVLHACSYTVLATLCGTFWRFISLKFPPRPKVNSKCIWFTQFICISISLTPGRNELKWAARIPMEKLQLTFFVYLVNCLYIKHLLTCDCT